MSAAALNVRVILSATRVGLLEIAQYRVATAIWATASIVQTVVYLAVWQVVATETGSTGGYTAATFAGYFVALLLVRELTYSWVPYQLPEHVRTGTLATTLLRPGHPLAVIFGRQLATRLNHVAILIPTSGILYWLFDATIDTSVAHVAVWVLVVPLAGAVRYLADSLFALSAMWLVKIDGLRTIYYLFVLFLSGQFAPISVLPGPVETLARVLPFYWTLGFPVELLVGTARVQDAWIGLLVLVGWTTVLAVAIRPVWRAGTRALESVGQ